MHDDFPGCSVAKTLHSQFRGPGFNPSSGNYAATMHFFTFIYTLLNNNKFQLKGALGSEKPPSVGGKLGVKALMPQNVVVHFLAK